MASIILVIAALALTVLAYPVQLALYWHFKTFPATNDVSWIKNACLSIAQQVILLVAFLKFFNKEKPTTLFSVYMFTLCAFSLHSLITYPVFSIALVIYFIVYVFITVDSFREFKLIKVTFVLYTLYTVASLAPVLFNTYYAVTLAEPFFVGYVEVSVTSFANLCVAVANLLYLLSRLKSAPKKENIPENM